VVFQKQIFDPGSEECLDGFAWGIHDRLPLHIEAGVENHLASGYATRGLQESMKRFVI
jgi:hypothetical protein